ncbi:hypothetical protein CMV_024315 [Castanea mollissima]|uniref:Uncharacterized protein n=1 Tax=Castanea mollissima TaxID=60419 RepID=A0A8J4QIE3_9ROSI|nr:hypothetical protein CMV_024315 [Castanea mollissima]
MVCYMDKKAFSRTSGYPWLGKALNKAEDSLFLSSVAMDGRDGKAIVQTSLLGTEIIVSNNTGCVCGMERGGGLPGKVLG